MDDFLFIARSRRLALRGRPYVEELLLLLGLSRSPTKGVWEPTQRLKHLGLGVDTRLMAGLGTHGFRGVSGSGTIPAAP